MPEKKKDPTAKFENLNWYEHIRLRPAMYIGNIGIKGVINLLKELFSNVLEETGADTITINLNKPNGAIITIENIKQTVKDDWSEWRGINSKRPVTLGFQTLNALSEYFKITLLNAQQKSLFQQEYWKGEQKSGDTNKNEIPCSEMLIEFILDEEIWGNKFIWNENFFSHEINEFAYLYKKVKFKILYQVEGENCNIIYYFKNGLKDRLEIEKLKGVGDCYLETTINAEIGDFYIEIAFAFRSYVVDEPFLKSFVNDYYTPENGSHVNGLLKGLTFGVMKYFQKHNLTEVYRISEKGMKENLIAIINIRINEPVFSGCVKNKLANPEIVKPISNFVSDILFRKIESDPESRNKLIQKFEI